MEQLLRLHLVCYHDTLLQITLLFAWHIHELSLLEFHLFKVTSIDIKESFQSAFHRGLVEVDSVGIILYLPIVVPLSSGVLLQSISEHLESSKGNGEGLGHNEPPDLLLTLWSGETPSVGVVGEVTGVG